MLLFCCQEWIKVHTFIKYSLFITFIYADFINVKNRIPYQVAFFIWVLNHSLRSFLNEFSFRRFHLSVSSKLKLLINFISLLDYSNSGVKLNDRIYKTKFIRSITLRKLIFVWSWILFPTGACENYLLPSLKITDFEKIHK